MDIGVLGAGVLNGAISGAFYGFSGWMVLGHDEKKFDGPKFLRAMLIGVVVGIYSALSGLPMPLAETDIHGQLGNLGILAGMSGFLDQFCIWAWKRVKDYRLGKNGPTVEEMAPKALTGLGEALKERVDATPTPPEIGAQGSNASVRQVFTILDPNGAMITGSGPSAQWLADYA